MGESFSISLSVIFAQSDSLCGIFIFSRKSNTQSTKELNEASFSSRYSLNFAILFYIADLLKVKTYGIKTALDKP